MRWLCASQAVIFACLSLLQVAPGQFFLPLLVLMHIGIVIFIRARRALTPAHADFHRIVRATHVLMVLYLPILLYKLLGRFGVVQVLVPLLQAATLGLAVLAAGLVIYSIRCARRCGIA